MANILVIEDDKRICEIVEHYLVKDGHKCFIANTGLEVLPAFEKCKPDLIILDLMLPHLDGFTICKLIRTLSNVPIIILTAKSDEVDKLKGYELGADDYVTKPFSPKVLIAKVRVLLRRSDLDLSQDILTGGKISLHPGSRSVYVDSEHIELTYKEYELLYIFMENQNIVFTREQLLKQVWEYEFEGNTRTIDTHIKTLRKKLGDAGSYIVTMIRSGYKFEVK